MPTTLDLRSPRPLRNDREYDAAVEEIDRLLDKDPDEGTAAARRLEFLSMLVEAYDDKHHELPARSTPQSMVLFVLDQHQKSRADLIPILGSKSRVSEFLNGKRRLSMAQISALRQEFGIPADLLIERDDSAAEAKTWAPRAARASRVREDSPRFEMAKNHAAGDGASQLHDLLERVEGAIEANTKVMQALLDELRRRRP